MQTLLVYKLYFLEKTMRTFPFIFSSLLIALFFSCQSDEAHVEQGVDSFTKNSATAILVKRVVQAPTKIDDVVDGSDDFFVALPVSIELNNQTIAITQKNDYGYVQFVKNKATNDSDAITYQFPITVKKANHEQQTIYNQTQYNAFVAEVNSTENHAEITCVEFNYPIKLKKYDTNNQVINTTTIESDVQMYAYFSMLTDADVVGFQYPFTIVNSNGQQETITSKAQLENRITTAIPLCATYYVGDFEYYFKQMLTASTWRIAYFYYDGQDETDYYSNYNCVFNTDLTVLANYNGNPYYGTWMYEYDSSVREIEIEFASSNLDEINEDWSIIDFSQTEIKLKHEDNGYDKFLTFSKI